MCLSIPSTRTAFQTTMIDFTQGLKTFIEHRNLLLRYARVHVGILELVQLVHRLHRLGWLSRFQIRPRSERKSIMFILCDSLNTSRLRPCCSRTCQSSRPTRWKTAKLSPSRYVVSCVVFNLLFCEYLSFVDGSEAHTSCLMTHGFW